MKQIWKHRYKIMENIGKGGNGQVYKVWDLHLEKEWAMKILEEKYLCKTKDRYEEIWDELQVLKRISYSNLPRIVDAFEEENTKVLIMDYIHGVTLEEMIRKGPLEEKQILHLAKQIGEAILYLHQQTPVLLYLDLKPSNIMVDEKGSVKLVDLGSVIRKGISGPISGSFGFSSPEQIKAQRGGRLLNEQSDIFSFGMVLYVMAAGNCDRLPMIEEKQKHGISVHKDNPGISRALENIIEKCTRGVITKRYHSMREVQKELENCERILKSKIKLLGNRRTGWKQKESLWYQERSILCTEGKHSFYIAKK